MNKMKDKLNTYANYNIISKPTTRKISSDFSWQQVYDEPGITEKELKRISIYLTEEIGGNINDDSLIQIASNSIKNSSCIPKNIVDYTTIDDDTANYYQSRNKRGSYICFDFLYLKIEIHSYLLKIMDDNFIKNWTLEGSNDNINCTVIDIRENCR